MVVRRHYTSLPPPRAATIALLSYQQTLILEEKDGGRSEQKDAPHRRPSPVPFRQVVLWRWFMMLASGLFTYAVNISRDIGQYTITSLNGYNQQKYYINAITASTKDIGITENTGPWGTDWKKHYIPVSTPTVLEPLYSGKVDHKHWYWWPGFLPRQVISHHGMVYAWEWALVSQYEHYQLHIGVEK